MRSGPCFSRTMAFRCTLALAFRLMAIGLLAEYAQAADPVFSQLVFPGADGHLSYKRYTDNGDTIPDFSHCGYGGGGVAIPEVAVKLALEPERGMADDLVRIQSAIDQVGRLPLDSSGFRGAVLLKRGTYRLRGQLKLTVSGIVLRGEGDEEQGTVLIATGRKQQPLIVAGGAASRQELPTTRQTIKSAYVPVGGRVLEVADATKFAVGDLVLVTRHGNAEWIHEIKMDQIAQRPNSGDATRQWKPFDLDFDRVIVGVRDNRLALDAPIACAIESRWGGGHIVKYDDRQRVEHVGVERLRAVSVFDRSRTANEKGRTYLSDEDHATHLIQFDHVKNAWARRVTTVHFGDGVALFGENAKWITVEDSSSIDPVSTITGGRRYPYNIGGQFILVQRCYARDARHAFAFEARVPGPNVFLDCKSENDHATSEPHHRWSVGGLYDNVQAPIAIQDRQWLGSGHGWSGANYVAWNCRGTLICQSPPTAKNFAIGFVGTKGKPAFEAPDGWWDSFGRHVEPRSLYLRQLEDRLGPEAAKSQSATK
jgi:hypothetical protein